MEKENNRVKYTMGYLQPENKEMVQNHNFMVLTEEEVEKLKVREYQVFGVMRYCLELLEKGTLSERDKKNIGEMYNIATRDKIIVKLVSMKKDLQ